MLVPGERFELPTNGLQNQHARNFLDARNSHGLDRSCAFSFCKPLVLCRFLCRLSLDDPLLLWSQEVKIDFSGLDAGVSEPLLKIVERTARLKPIYGTAMS